MSESSGSAEVTGSSGLPASLDVTSLLQQWAEFWVRAASPGSWSVTRDNAQDIETSLVRGGQLGLFNLSVGNSGDPELERRIVTQVASYGRQLGKLLDAVNVLARHPPGGLDDDDRAKLGDVETLAAEVVAVKQEAAREHARRTVAQVQELCRDPDANKDVLDEIRTLLGRAGT